MHKNQIINNFPGFNEATTISGLPFENRILEANQKYNRKKLNLIGYCAVGTFGIATFFMGTSTSNTPIRNHLGSLNVNKASNREFAHLKVDISFLKSKANLSISEIANTLQVSRQSVHNWMNGGSISIENSVRLASFVQAIKMFDDFKMPVTPYSLRRRIGGEQSVLDAISSGNDVTKIAQSLIKTLQFEIEQRNMIASRRKDNSSKINANILSESNTPELQA